MTTLRNLPNSDEPDLRDYLFIDDARVATLLAQFGEGSPMTRSEQSGRTRHFMAGWNRVFGMSIDQQSSESVELSLSAMHVTMLEEDATSHNLLADISLAASRKKWLRGQVRNEIMPGSLIRVTAPTRVTDPRNMLSQFFDIGEAMGDMDEDLRQFRDVIEGLYGNALSFSCYPCDEDHEAAFEGFIETQRQGLWFDRETLTARMGTEPTEMTCLMQVSRVPTERDSDNWKEAMADFDSRFKRVDPDRLDRSFLTRMIEGVVRVMESTGLRAAPRWPAIAVTPLAMYRQVGTALTIEDADVEAQDDPDAGTRVD